jgi:hypothetical protein
VTKAGWMNLGGVTVVGNAAISAATDLLTITAHGLVDGDIVTVDALVGGGTELRADSKYTVRSTTANTFRLSAPEGGEMWQFESDGTCDVYLGSPSYAAVEMRRLNAIALHPGSVDRLGAREGVRPHSSDPVTVAGANPGTYTVAEGLAVVYPRETSTSAPYVVEYAAQNSVSLNAPDGTNPRLDGIDLQVQDDDEDGSGQRRARIVYVPGTPASSPSAPTITDNSLRLATILVPANGSPAPSVSSMAQYALGAAVVPIRTTAERPTSGLYNGLMCWRQDIKALEVWDGSAWVVIATAGGFQLLTTVRFTSSGSFTKATYTGLRAIRVRCQAGGGGGEYSEKWILAASLGTSETVTIGAGGAGGTSGNTGTSGGNTTFGSLCTAIGGAGGGGRASTTSSNAATGGLGGTGGTADFRVKGGGGGAGTAAAGTTEMGMPGLGGASVVGPMARGSRGGAGITGDAGTLYGGGGCGAVNGPSASARAGAAGAAGICIVDVYV